MNAVVQHSSRSPEWGTPDCVLERARKLCPTGRIGFDPFTSREFNERVGAANFLVANALECDWPGEGIVLVNPPGLRLRHRPSMPARAWRKLMEQRELGHIDHAVWVGFTLEHLGQCQPEGLPALAHFPACYPRKRLRFVRPDGTPGKAPGHANVIAYVPGEIDKRELFYELFEPMGACR